MAVIAFQSNGRNHIRYINRLAHNMWEGYGYREELKMFCLREALKKHVKYLEDVDRINKEIEERENRRVAENATSKKHPTMFWRDQKTGKWEPLIT